MRQKYVWPHPWLFLFSQKEDFEKLFFLAIKEVSSYIISDKRLIFKYENDSKKMIFELKEKQYIHDSEYFIAKINGVNWSGDKDYISARLKAQIARNYWKNEGWYSILLTSDDQLNKALTLFNEAKDLAKLK